MAGQPTPPGPRTPPPPEIAGLMIRAYSPLVSLNKALLNPYFGAGGYVRGGWLTSHDPFLSMDFLFDFLHEFEQCLQSFYTVQLI